jgi:hypothetical protein
MEQLFKVFSPKISLDIKFFLEYNFYFFHTSSRIKLFV